jgi:hypothetical protein
MICTPETITTSPATGTMPPIQVAASSQLPVACEVIVAEYDFEYKPRTKINIQATASTLLPNPWKLSCNLTLINVTVPPGCKKDRFNCHATYATTRIFYGHKTKKL